MTALPADHAERVTRAKASLDGLSVGDAFGDQFFAAGEEQRIEHRIVQTAPWFYTDDTEMALAIVDVLEELGEIDTDFLAMRFAHRYERRPQRGYGATAHSILRAIAAGRNYRQVTPAVFEGQGSMGNGAAMRAGPLGAYFATDGPQRIVEESLRSAEVTHAHPEGAAGAAAVALGAAWAANNRGNITERSQQDFLKFAMDYTPGGYVREGIAKAYGFESHCSVMMAAAVLGNGSKVSAPDTVPFALWCASHHLEEFEQGAWVTVSALGDRDTTCAIFGSIVGLSAPWIPASWLAAREPLEFRVE
jgi:ADP-ribosylglycohydrolase